MRGLRLIWILITDLDPDQNEIEEIGSSIRYESGNAEISVSATYRVTSYTWPFVSGTLLKVTSPLNTEQITFYTVSDQHGQVYLVRLYHLFWIKNIGCP